MGIASLDLLHLAYISLRGKSLRSFLSTLGIFMGVVAVSAPLQVSNISHTILTKEIELREAPQVIIYPHWDMVRQISPAELKMADLEYLKARLTGLKAISTAITFSSQKILFRDREADAEVQAVSQEFLQTTGQRLTNGRFFKAADFDKYRNVVVIDEFLREQLFPEEDPINQRIYFQNRPYFVVGVMERKQSLQGQPTGLMLLPISLYSVFQGRSMINNISLRPTEASDLEKLGDQAVKLMMQRHLGQKFSHQTNINDIVARQQQMNKISLTLLVLGAIALAVGGVGITNITIASVLERTSEIGLRRALGATKSDIMIQFLLEAVLLSLFGGTIALVTLHGITIVVANKFNLPYEFNSNIAALALGSSLVTGVGAGFFPAQRASRLDPVFALRS